MPASESKRGQGKRREGQACSGCDAAIARMAAVLLLCYDILMLLFACAYIPAILLIVHRRTQSHQDSRKGDNFFLFRESDSIRTKGRRMDGIRRGHGGVMCAGGDSPAVHQHEAEGRGKETTELEAVQCRAKPWIEIGIGQDERFDCERIASPRLWTMISLVSCCCSARTATRSILQRPVSLSRHLHAPASAVHLSVPKPSETLSTPLHFFTATLRPALIPYADKISTWEDLFTPTLDLAALGMTVQERRFTKWCLNKVR